MNHVATPSTAAGVLASTKPGDNVFFRGGSYLGTYTLKVAGVTLAPFENEPAIFTGPEQYVKGGKPAWLTIAAAARGASVRGLRFERPGDIAALHGIGWNDYGIVIEAPDVEIDSNRLFGMNKGVHVKGKNSTGGRITANNIGPTIQSNIVLATSYGVIRALVIDYNTLEGSYKEDGIQFMQDFDAADQTTDVSNLGVIIRENDFGGHGENGIDLKGAGLVVIEENRFVYVAGSNDGPVSGWNHNGGPVITRGKGTNSGHVIIRNNAMTLNCSGMLVMPQWYVYHNYLLDNNWTPDGSDYAGFGIAPRQGGPTAAVVNNLVSGHKGGNVLISSSAIVRNNPDKSGPGAPLTTTVGDGSGFIVPVVNAAYFTGWFGRKDLPAETIYIGTQPAQIVAVDYAANLLELSLSVYWKDGDPVNWLTPEPTTGLASAYAPPPTTETVRLLLDVDVSPGLAAELRKAVGEGKVKVAWG